MVMSLKNHILYECIDRLFRALFTIKLVGYILLDD